MAGEANDLPEPQVAYQNVFNGVHARVFFQKVAALRPHYVPQNQKQADYLLTLAGKLRMVEQEAAVKQAEDANDPFAAANAALDGVLAHHGFTSVKSAQVNDEEMAQKQAAAFFMNDPDLYDSVLSLKSWEAAQYARQMAAQGN